MRFRTRRHYVMAGAMLCAALSVSSCQVAPLGVGVDDGVLRRGHAIFEDQTCVRTDTYEVVSTKPPMELCIRIGIRSGAVDWLILGPDGQNAQGSGDATSGEAYHVDYCMDMSPGDWEFVLDMTEASGEYEVVWYAPGSAPSVPMRLPKPGG
jgi:hypothetical protein